MDNGTNQIEETMSYSFHRFKMSLRHYAHQYFDAVYKHFCFIPQVLSSDEVVEYIVKNHASLARIGDGELVCMYGKDLNFQKCTPWLQQMMHEVCAYDDEKLLIGIPDVFERLERYNEVEQRFWQVHFYFQRRHWMQVLKRDKRYATTFLSRFYSMEYDKELAAHRLIQLRRLWEGRNVIFIEGKDSKMGVGNDLFDNTASIRRILGPSKNAMDRYDELLRAALDHAASDTLFILALGPTATILAYDLCRHGHQALDLGHMDIEYEWYKMGATSKVPVTGKFSNEAAINMGLASEVVGSLQSTEYEEQIVAVID